MDSETAGSTPDPDAELVSQARLGDTAAFSALIDRHQDLLLGLALSVLHDRQKAEDAVQDALVSAWKGLPKYRAEARFRNWLCRILLNKTRSELRWSSIRRWIRLDAPLSETQQTWIDTVPDAEPGADPQAAAVQAERDKNIRAAVASLPEKQRIAVTLRAEGMSLIEIAASMDVAEGTVKAHLHAARGKIDASMGAA